MAVKKIRFGTPEEIVPSRYCRGFNYREGKIAFDTTLMRGEKTPRGYLVEFPIAEDEQIFGFGLQHYQFNHKGTKLVLRVNADARGATGDSHAPVPFFVTSKKRGFYVDTARAAEFYCGYPRVQQAAAEGQSADNTDDLYAVRKAVDTTWMSILIPAAEGVDIYVFEGENLAEVVSQYNMLAGGGCHIPDWGLGTLFRTHTLNTEKGVMEAAELFKAHRLPISVIGIEPGWETKQYSSSYVVNTESYPHFGEMVKKLRDMGYHVNLWEQCFVNPEAPFYDELKQYAGDFPVWNGLVPDFTFPEARKLFADHHRKALVDLGVDGFKADECDGSDYTGGWSFPLVTRFPSGADGEQMHSLLGVLYAQAVMEAVGDQGTISEIRSFGALAAPYPFVLYSDLYDHTVFIRSLVNSGFSGLLWAPEMRSCSSKKDLVRRLQTVVFSAHSLINAWCCDEIIPWSIHDCEDEARELLELRESLRPRLRAAFDRYEATGYPPVRALVMDFTDDPETYKIDTEYMFCDNLLVAPLTAASDTRKVYLPAGQWVDFFTREPIEAGWHDVTTEQIPVFEKIG